MTQTKTNLRFMMLAAASGLALAIGGCDERSEETDVATAATSEVATPAPPPATPASTFAPIEMRMKEQIMAAMGGTLEHTWAMKMVAHHQGAIDMSQALLSASPSGPMHDRAQQTAADQQKEIGDLQAWLQGHQASGSGASPFEQAEQQMHQKMMAATGATLDETWARKMIEHHQGAVDMARIVLKGAKDAEIRRMAQMTIDKQTKEIAELRSMISG